VIGHFVKIGGIDDHHCLNFLFINSNRCQIFYHINVSQYFKKIDFIKFIGNFRTLQISIIVFSFHLQNWILVIIVYNILSFSVKVYLLVEENWMTSENNRTATNTFLMVDFLKFPAWSSFCIKLVLNITITKIPFTWH